mgnify:CR=1 FL=1
MLLAERLCLGVGERTHDDGHAAFHQLFHVVASEKVGAVGMDDAGGMVLGHAVKPQLLCQHEHGGIHIDTCQNFFHVFFVIKNDTGIFRHEIQTNKIHYDLIHFFYCHVSSSSCRTALMIIRRFFAP